MPEPQEPEVILDRLRRRVLEGPGQLDVSVRQAAFHDNADALPRDLVAYVAKVQHRAYEVIDEDVDGLRDSGLTEDQIFELTIAAAVGAGLRRFDLARAAREGSKS